jgi:uncharacterized protein DUF5667
VDSVNRGQHDRAVVRALRSLEPLTGPTAAERRRIRDRVLIALDAEAASEDPVPLAEVAPARSERPGTADEPTTDTDPVQAGDTEPTIELEADTEQDPSTGTDPVADGKLESTLATKSRTVSPKPRHAKARPATGTRPGTSSRPTTASPKARPDTRRGVLAGARGRLAVASLALLTLVGSLVGMSVLLSRDALPGDALYGVKRTAEAASLGLTFGDEPKALKHLEFASARITEIETLARRYPNPSDAPVGGYLTALTDFDNDAIAGSRELITLATSTDGRLLDSLRDWSTQQATRLRQVDHLMPEDARARASATRALLDHITARSDALAARMDCFQITSGTFDDIGALPATVPCEEKPAATSGEPQPSVSGTPDNSGPVTPGGTQTASPPIPPAAQTPEVPLVPVPGATVSVPVPNTRPTTPGSPTTSSTPPLIELPPILPGLPGIGIG